MSFLRAISERLLRRTNSFGRGGGGSRRLEDLSEPEDELPEQEHLNLYEACTRSEDVRDVRTLMERNPETDIINVRFGPTKDAPLHLAARSANYELTKFLIDDCGGNIEIGNQEGHTPLHLAAAYGYQEYSSFLINRYGADLYAKDYEWRGTPLHLAVQFGHDSYVRYCLDKFELDKNLQDGFAGDALLHWAAWYGNASLVRTLVGTYHANPNIKNEGGQTPLQYASMMGYGDLVELLVETFKANVNVKSYNKGFAPLHYAAANDRIEIVMLLVEDFGANVDIKDSAWRTPRDLARETGAFEVSQYLEIVNNDLYHRHEKLRSAGCKIENECPEEFICPITFCIMTDPMFTLDGYSYEGTSIKDWFRLSNRSPKTNKELSQTLTVPNHILKTQILEWTENTMKEYGVSSDDET